MLTDTYKKFQRTPKKNLFLRFVRGSLNPWLINMTAPADYSPQRSVVLLGDPRSGTTWLAELLCTVPGSALLFEPLYFPRVKAARDANIDWHTFYRSDEPWPQGKAFFEQVLTGQILTHWTTSFTPIPKALHPQRWVIKMIRANLLLGWLLHNFPYIKPILIIRHPCATILSKRQQGWPPLTYPPRLRKVEQAFPHLRDIRKSLRHPIEFETFLWCISYFVALSAEPQERYLLVHFEQLVRNGDEELQRIFSFLQIDMPENSLTRLNRRSQMTKKDSPLYQDGDPLKRWQEKMAKRDIDMVLNIVTKFGLESYIDN